MTSPRADSKTKETAPQFAEASGGDDGLEVLSKPVRDPSLDTLLEGLEERLDHVRSAKLRVHTPPNAQTDPFPEEPVVAPNLTAPLSALAAQKQASAERAARVAPAPPRHDPTFVLDREPTMTRRGWMVVAGSLLVVAGALVVAVWAARGTDAPDAPRAEPLPASSASSASVASVAPALVEVPAPAPVPTPVATTVETVQSTIKPAVRVPASKPPVVPKPSSTPPSANPPSSGDLKPVP